MTGLPQDATVEEVEALFKKGGVILVDPDTQLPRIKLYRDENDALKGDALIVYFRPESVGLAIDLLHETLFRADSKVTLSVEAAEFKEKNPKLTEATDLPKSKKKKAGKVIDKLHKQLDWDEGLQETDQTKKSVILSNMFTLHELEEQPELLLEIKEDIRIECSKIGPVANVTLFDVSIY